MTSPPGGLLLIDRDDLHSGGLCVPGEVRHLARRALPFTGRRDAGVYDRGVAIPLHKCSPTCRTFDGKCHQ